VLSLPICPELSAEQQSRVIEVLLELTAKSGSVSEALAA
jgi:dTDP-4-amino-4,6-dideoxygalactose transaminase